MEATTNEVARGNDDGSPNSECGGGRDGQRPTAPALTPQQKQELSTYNFKGAEAALEAQANQPAPKPSPLTPIPPLKVPPITSRGLPWLSLHLLALRRTKVRRFR